MRTETTLYIDGYGNPRREIVTYLADTPQEGEQPVSVIDPIGGYPDSVVVDALTWDNQQAVKAAEAEAAIPDTPPGSRPTSPFDPEPEPEPGGGGTTLPGP